MTALEKYLAELNKQKQLAEGRFNNLNSFQNQLLNSSYAWLLNNLNLQNGVFEVPGNLPGLMNSFVDNILRLAEKSTNYTGAVQNFITDLNVIKKNITDYHSSYNNIIVDTPGLKRVQKAVIGEVIDQYSENGLNSHFAQPLRELMYGNILAGMSQSDAKKYLQEYIIGERDESGKLQRYLEQTAQQGVDSYAGAINMKLKKDFNFTGYIISGSLIDNSSQQCIHAIKTSENGYLKFSDWEKVLQMARENKKAKLIDGTTLENLPLNKLHWGCRHEFTPFFKAEDHVEPPKVENKPKKPTPKPKAEPKPKPAPKEAPLSKTQLEKRVLETKLVKGADFAKLDDKTAQIFEATATDLLSTFALTPINLSGVKLKGTFRGRANGGKIDIHGTNIKGKEASAKRYEENKPIQIKNNLARIKDWEEALKDKKPGNYQHDIILREIKQLEQANEDIKGFTRWTVEVKQEGTVIHEMGHVIHDQRSGFINGNTFVQDKFKKRGTMGLEEEALNIEWRQIFERVEESPEKYKVSEYALYNPAELFAECFCLYYQNRKNELPTGVEKYLDKYLKPLIKK